MDISDIARPAPSEQLKPDSAEWLKYLSALWYSRKLIGLTTAVATVGAVIISLLLAETFKSTATLLPETEKSKLASLGGLSDLAALAGVSVGGDGSVAKLYPTIIESEAVLRNVIYSEYRTKKYGEPVNLIKFWEIEEATPDRNFEVALKSLRDLLDVSFEVKTNVVTISIETREPQLSAAIVNKATSELDAFIRTKRTTNAGEQRKWIEERLGNVKKDLEKSENTLKEFREKNRRIGDSPQLLLEQGRLMREVQINSTLYEELKKQHEIAKIEEIKNIPIINVMDPGRPPARKENPKRRNIVLAAFFLSFAAVSAWVILRHRYRDLLTLLVNEIVGWYSLAKHPATAPGSARPVKSKEGEPE